jgi:tyrosine-protein phosphatase YwqE
MLSKLFKRKKPLDPIELSNIAVDMHSHLIPGIDDGSKSMDETIAMLAKFQHLGYRKVITTPHIMSDYYRNTPEIILSGLENVREVASKLGLTIEIEAAAEYYFDDHFLNLIKKKELLTFGENHVLVEFDFSSKPMYENEMFFELLTVGYKPVLAHFERYSAFHGKLEKAIEYRSRGVLIQLNLNSLTGHYGPEVKKQAERLIDNGLVDFVGTDCHRMQHLMTLEENLNLPYMHKLLDLELKNRQLF